MTKAATGIADFFGAEKIAPIDIDLLTVVTDYVGDLRRFVQEHKMFLDAAIKNDTTFEVPVHRLIDYNIDLVDTIFNNPGAFFEYLRLALLEIYFPDQESIYIPKKHQAAAEEISHHIKFVRFNRRTPIRAVRQKNARRTVSIEGIIRSISDVRGIITEGQFLCASCNHHTPCKQMDPYTITLPSHCHQNVNGCTGHTKFLPKDLNMFKSTKIDGEYGTIQEFPEGLSGGGQPQSLDLVMTRDLVQKVTSGQRVILNGIVRERLLKKDSPIIGYYLDVHSIEFANKDYDEIEITPDDEFLFATWAAQGNVLSTILDAIAPSIYGHRNIKEAIAYQLFGGTADTIDGVHQRGDIHILLLGDPGVAKSQILRYAIGLSPRGIFTNGRGTTTAGLTATAQRDKDTDKWSLEAGALVLADGGICAVDEIDKMDPEHRSSFHEAMESQTVTVTKATINASLHTRCAILAAANPKNGCWDDCLNLKDQINLEPTILSRFDLIFLLKDRADAEKDSRLASHILNQARTSQLRASGEEVPNASTATISREILRKYVAYCRKTIFPVLTDAANTIFHDYFIEIRQKAGQNKPVPITPRNLKAMIRIAEARARLQMKSEIDADDAAAVIAIVESCLRSIALDESTGLIDSTVLETGRSRTQNQMLDEIVRTIERLQEDDGKVHEQTIYAAFPAFPRDKLNRMLEQLNQEGRIIKPRTNFYRI